MTTKEFNNYHTTNPAIYNAFRAFTLKAIERGHKAFSAEFIFNIIRWETNVSAEGKYKVNNDAKPHYARLFMSDNPQYDGFFITRNSKADAYSAAA